MQQILTLILFLLLGAGSLSAQVEARVHQVFDIKKSSKVKVKIDDSRYEVNIKESYSTVIVVEAIIMLDHASPDEIENVIKTGRYNVKVDYKDGTIFISSPENKAPVVINGNSAEEFVTYNISIPEYLEY